MARDVAIATQERKVYNMEIEIVRLGNEKCSHNTYS